MTAITPAERMIFDRERDRIAAGPVLDLGIGAGRTTAFLAPLCPSYYGVDYSPVMTAYCRERFAALPCATFILADAASLPMLPSESFAFILFSFNGLDSVSHDHRLRILQEVHRLLARNGRFAFSAHNRFYRDIQRVPRFRRPLRARGVARAGIEFANHVRLRGKSGDRDEYELINDPPHLFSLITYYIGWKAQVAQLERQGFAALSVIDADGRALCDGDDDTLSPDFHYLTEIRS